MDKLRVPARCETSRDEFVMVFRNESDQWVATAAEAPGNADGTAGDSGATRQTSGSFVAGPQYDGCRSCGRTAFFKCGNCDNLGCWNGTSDEVQCPWCDTTTVLKGSIGELEGHEGGDDEPTSGLLGRK